MTIIVNRKAYFLQNESIQIDSHNESNRIDLNRELGCSTTTSRGDVDWRGRQRHRNIGGRRSSAEDARIEAP